MMKWISGVLKNQKTAISYTSGTVFNSFAQIISNVVILAYVGPEDMGIWNSLLLFQTYSLFLQAGVINGLNLELPFYLGKNNRPYAESLASTALYFFLGSIALCFLLGLLVFSFNLGKPALFHYTFSGILFITITKFYENYLTSTFRSDQAFEKLSRAYILRGLFLLLSVLLVVLWGYYGYMLRMVMTSVIFTFLLHRNRPIRVKPKWNKQEFLHLFKIGLPIFLLAYIFSVSGTVDRLLLIKYEGVTVVGFYSLAMMIYAAFQAIPVSLSNYIYPKMSFAFGRSNDIMGLTNKAFKVNLLVLVIMIPIALLGYFLLPFIIPALFPKYTDGISSAQILLFAAVFSGASIGGNVLWSMKKWRFIYISQIGGAILNVTLIYLGYNLFEEPLIGIAAGVLMSQVVYMFLTNLLIFLTAKNEGVTTTVA